MAFAIVLGAGLIGAVRSRAWRDVGLLTGASASIGLLHLALGSSAVSPGLERYAVHSVPVTVLAVIMALRHSVGPVVPVALAGGVGLLIVTYSTYPRPLQEDGSSTHEAFLVGRTTDPKQRVWPIVEDQADRDEAVARSMRSWRQLFRVCAAARGEPGRSWP